MEVKTLESVLAESGKNYKSTDVTKEIDLEFDIGNLIAVDPNPLSVKEFRKDKEGFLKNLARDDIQLLINKLWDIPATRRDDAVVIDLPPGTTKIPREKPIPKPKPPTRWEQYAKTKGIQKKNKSHLVWDDQHKEFRPKFGYKRANDQSKDWAMEVKDSSDPNVDPFTKKSEEKKERTAKNEYQRLKNISRSSKLTGVLPVSSAQQNKQQLSKAIANARVATASIGNFVDDIPNEKPHMKRLGKKRKFEPTVSDFEKEKKKNLDILEKVNKHEPKIDIDNGETTKREGKKHKKTAGKKVGKKSQKRKGKK